MYRVKSNGTVAGYSDTLVYIRLHSNGCYVSAPKEQAGGFCVKQSVTRTNEDGVTETYLADTVYKFGENTLKGTEPIGEAEEVNGAMLMAMMPQYEEALNILGVETEAADEA